MTGKKILRKVKGFWVAVSLTMMVASAGMPLTGVVVARNAVSIEALWNNGYATDFADKATYLKDESIRKQVEEALSKTSNPWKENTVDEIKAEIARQKDLGNAVYVIQWGDTLSNLAQACDMTVAELASQHGLSSMDMLLTGDILDILSGPRKQSSVESNTTTDKKETKTESKVNTTTPESASQTEETTTSVETSKPQEPVTTVQPTQPSDPTTTVQPTQPVGQFDEVISPGAGDILVNTSQDVQNSTEAATGTHKETVTEIVEETIYETVTETITEMVDVPTQVPVLDEAGNPVLDANGNPMVETVNVPTPVEKQITKQVPKVVQKEVTKEIDVPNDPIKVVTTTTVKDFKVPFDTRTIYDPTLPEGTSTVEQEGKDGAYTITDVLVTKDGQPFSHTYSKTNVVVPVEKVVRVGTKAAPVVTTKQEITTNPIPFTKETRNNPNLAQGQTQVVQAGKDGVETITYEVTYTDGVETGRKEVSRQITTAMVPEITEIGTKATPVVTTKQETTTNPIPFTKETRNNPNLAQGQTQVVQAGKDGVETITYEVTYTDGVETGRKEVSRQITTAMVPEITEIGTKATPVVTTKQETTTNPIPFTKETRNNPNLAQGQTQVVQAGKDGVETITYEVTYTDGVETGRKEVSRQITTAMVPEITEIGTKVAPAPVVTTKQETTTSPIPFTKQTRENPNMVQGFSRVIQNGVNGVETITYEVTYTDGVETARTELSRQITTAMVPEITEVGTKVVLLKQMLIQAQLKLLFYKVNQLLLT